MKTMMDDIIYEYPILQYYPILFISVKNNFRLGKVLESSLEIYNRRINKYSTKELNDFLKSILISSISDIFPVNIEFSF